jgi:hypothetical protein
MYNSLSHIQFEFENSTNLINFCNQYKLSLINKNQIDYSLSIIPANYFEPEDEIFLIEALQAEEPIQTWKSEIDPWLDYLASEQAIQAQITY